MDDVKEFLEYGIERGNPAEALPILELCVQGMTSLYGADHSETVAAQKLLKAALSALGSGSKEEEEEEKEEES